MLYTLTVTVTNSEKKLLCFPRLEHEDDYESHVRVSVRANWTGSDMESPNILLPLLENNTEAAAGVSMCMCVSVSG